MPGSGVTRAARLCGSLRRGRPRRRCCRRRAGYDGIERGPRAGPAGCGCGRFSYAESWCRIVRHAPAARFSPTLDPRPPTTTLEGMLRHLGTCLGVKRAAACALHEVTHCSGIGTIGSVQNLGLLFLLYIFVRFRTTPSAIPGIARCDRRSIGRVLPCLRTTYAGSGRFGGRGRPADRIRSSPRGGS